MGAPKSIFLHQKKVQWSLTSSPSFTSPGGKDPLAPKIQTLQMATDILQFPKTNVKAIFWVQTKEIYIFRVLLSEKLK